MRTATYVMGCSCLLLVACGADSSSTGGQRMGTDPNDPFSNASGGSGASGAAGTFGNTSTAGSGTGGTGTAGGDAPKKQDCATAEVKPSKVKPIIDIVVDGSGSMCADYSGQSRWQALRSALLDPASGLIKRLENQVEFGMVLYDGTINVGLAAGGGAGPDNPSCAGKYVGPKATGMCPQLIEVAPAIMNFTAIDTAYPQTELGGSTPTDKALTHVMDQLIPAAEMDPDRENHPRYVILATDGQPNDICMGGAGGDGSANRAEVITQVMRGVQAAVNTYVISLAGSSAELQMHLDMVAAAGGTGTMAFSPMTKDDLVMTLGQIIGGAIGCQIFLNGEVTAGQECMGYVEVDGMLLTCNDPDGWRLVDAKTIELTGKACLDFMNNPDATLEAGFPCGVFRPL